ncbi:hypothetical protein L2E82_15012 [Cichorium intybus]|uniref:Uncharacterized protein n=1 Tax=Cichorium intybus TaxID=13427 RepID=A0ACB9F0Y8_CICIN|nr:hypothetical protein L2E82_15012 [Cichorium intybus]
MHSSTNARRKCLECYLSPAEMNLHGPVVEPRAQKGYNQSETVRVLKGCRRDSAENSLTQRHFTHIYLTLCTMAERGRSTASRRTYFQSNATSDSFFLYFDSCLHYWPSASLVTHDRLKHRATALQSYTTASGSLSFVNPKPLLPDRLQASIPQPSSHVFPTGIYPSAARYTPCLPMHLLNPTYQNLLTFLLHPSRPQFISDAEGRAHLNPAYSAWGSKAKEMKLKFDIQNNRKGPMDAGTEVYGWLLFYVPKGHYKAL